MNGNPASLASESVYFEGFSCGLKSIPFMGMANRGPKGAENITSSCQPLLYGATKCPPTVQRNASEPPDKLDTRLGDVGDNFHIKPFGHAVQAGRCSDVGRMGGGGRSGLGPEGRGCWFASIEGVVVAVWKVTNKRAACDTLRVSIAVSNTGELVPEYPDGMISAWTMESSSTISNCKSSHRTYR
jgi:hypothetical protein